MIERTLSKLNSIPADKALHFIAGVILFAVAVPFIGPQYAFALAVIAGFVKELYDSLNKDNHTPDIWDALVTSAGGALGFYCSYF
jgi:predicted membrane protein